jgi:dUTP pyrophosphatase
VCATTPSCPRRPTKATRGSTSQRATGSPRSGLAAKHGLTIVNSPGLIDAGYRGEVKVIVLNTDEREPFVVEPGMRIAQLVLVEAAGVRLVEVDELSISERGTAGLGSSG